MSWTLLQYALPIVWALVATAIALLLYKSSDAFFEQVHTTEGTKRTLRLVGSIVIAAVAFIGMMQATRSLPTDPRSPPVPLAVLQENVAAASNLEAAWGKAEGCLHLTTADECRAELDAVGSRVAAIGQASDQLEEVVK